MSELRIDGETVQISGTILDTVMELNKNPDSYLYMIGNRPVPVDSVPMNGQTVNAIRVASGG